MADYPVKPGPTKWTLIRSAQGVGADAHVALGELIRRYEKYVMVLIRCRRHPPDMNAEELKQELFAQMLARGDFAKLNRELGSFRGFLKQSVRYFVANEWRKWKALKNGRDATNAFSFDVLQQTTENLICDAIFAKDTLNHVLERLECEARDKARFEALKRVLPGPQLGPVAQAALASSLGTTPGALRVQIHRLRARFDELLDEAIGDTLDLDPRDPTFAQAIAKERCLLYQRLCEAPSLQVMAAEP